MTEIVLVVDEAPAGGFIAQVECHFDEGRVPKVIRLHLVRDGNLAP